MSEGKRGALARKLRGRISEPIAIIATACRAPGARSPEQLWDVLRDARDMVGDIPVDRWDATSFFDPNPGTPGKMITRWAGVVDAVDRFDAEFFGISAPEATQLDPQQRLVLEVAWEAFERADLPTAELAGSSTGVFLGIMNGDYFISTYTGPRSLDMYAATGTSHNISAGRLSYFFDLRGPCESVDTACSSSLVAIHRACQSLRSGECELALAGGVNVIVDPWLNVCLSAMGAISPSGRCRAFDSAADGMVRGDGCGMVLLKRLSDAERDGDRVLAVIAGSSVNHNGRGQGLTAPNGLAHRALIRQALDNAALRPSDIRYVEAHGTGTRLGDPIELSALADALAGDEQRRVAVGSLKTNLGHLESAAGVMSVIKVVESFAHGEVPPQLHLKNVSEHIELERQPLVIASERRPLLDRDSGPARAGVSAFGLSGTNAHLVIESPPEAPLTSADQSQACCLVFAARSDGALRSLARSIATFLREHPTAVLADVCTAINRRAAPFSRRVAFFASERAQMVEALDRFADGGDAAERWTLAADDESPELTLVCPDDTSGDLAAVASLRAPGAAETVAACLEAFAAVGVTAPERGDTTERRAAMAFSFACGVVAAVRASGIEPVAIVGASGPSSVGGAAAAYASGAADLDTCVAACVAAARTPSTAAAPSASGLVLMAAPTARPPKWTAGPRAEARQLGDFLVRLLALVQMRGGQVRWETVLGGSRRAVPPLPTYPFERRRYWAQISPVRDMGVTGGDASAAKDEVLGARLRRLNREDRARALDDYLRRELADALGTDVVRALAPQQTLVDAGLTSVLAMSVRNRLQTDLGLQLPLTLVFEHPTLPALVAHLEQALTTAS